MSPAQEAVGLSQECAQPLGSETGTGIGILAGMRGNSREVRALPRSTARTRVTRTGAPAVQAEELWAGPEVWHSWR